MPWARIVNAVVANIAPYCRGLANRAALPTVLACSSLTAGRMRRDPLTAEASRREVSEQRRAVEPFRALAQPYRFRVQADAEGYPIIPGRYGQVEWFDGQDLAVHSTRPRLFAKLWAIPGVKRHRTGEREMRAVFPPEALEQVAIVIKARRRRTLAPGVARRRGFKPTHRATSGG